MLLHQTLAAPCCRSKKYQELVKKAGGEAPAPIVTLRKVESGSQQGESLYDS